MLFCLASHQDMVKNLVESWNDFCVYISFCVALQFISLKQVGIKTELTKLWSMHKLDFLKILVALFYVLARWTFMYISIHYFNF